MNGEKQKKFGTKVVGMSLPFLLICSTIVLVGAIFNILSSGASVAMFLLGLILTRPLLLLYKTGDSRYAALSGGGFGLGSVVMFFFGPPKASFWLVGPYGAVCSLTAIFLLFFIFRRRFLRFIGESKT